MLYTLTSGIYPTHLKKVGSEGHRSKQKNKKQKTKKNNISANTYQVKAKTDFIAFQLNDVDGMYHNSD